MTIQQTITPAEAERAIYIDFEGRKGEKPVLLGVLYAEGRRAVDPKRVVFRQDILDPVFAELEGVIPFDFAKHIYRYDSDVLDPFIAVRNVVRRATNQNRLIVAWSQHELGVIQQLCAAQGLSEHFEALFRDGKETAKRWLKQTHPGTKLTRDDFGGAHKLARYMDLVNWEVPAEFGQGVVGDNLKTIRDLLTKGRPWDTFTDRTKLGWRAILGHNLHDCLGMRAVVTIAAAGLSSTLHQSAAGHQRRLD